jgi:hypothetical protein
MSTAETRKQSKGEPDASVSVDIKVVESVYHIIVSSQNVVLENALVEFYSPHGLCGSGLHRVRATEKGTRVRISTLHS